jgi:hypothetical protein
METMFTKTNHPNIYFDDSQKSYVVLTAFGNYVHFDDIKSAMSYRDTSRNLQDNKPENYFKEK